jgi:hypothetical protein
MFRTQAEAKRFFVSKVVGQARVESMTLSDAEQRMLSWSESDPDFVADPRLPEQLAAKISDKDYETKIVGLLWRSFSADVERAPEGTEARSRVPPARGVIVDARVPQVSGNALGRQEMSLQTISTDFWEARFPEDWSHKDQGLEYTTYFEAPDHSQGVYLSTWRNAVGPLLTAMLNTREIERRTLPTTGAGQWAELRSTESEDESHIEVRTEYFNSGASYRSVSRILGRADCYVRLAYHDYGCSNPWVSAERSEPWIRSLCLRSVNAE